MTITIIRPGSTYCREYGNTLGLSYARLERQRVAKDHNRSYHMFGYLFAACSDSSGRPHSRHEKSHGQPIFIPNSTTKGYTTAIQNVVWGTTHTVNTNAYPLLHILPPKAQSNFRVSTITVAINIQTAPMHQTPSYNPKASSRTKPVHYVLPQRNPRCTCASDSLHYLHHPIKGSYQQTNDRSGVCFVSV